MDPALLRGRTSGPNPLGPLVAAIIITAIVAGRAGLREFFHRLVRWRVGARWYAVTFITPVLVCLIATGITCCFAPPSELATLSIEKVREVPERFLFILLFIGLGEEPGWRGFALPQLQTNHSPLRASLILAPLWALWHLPLIGNEFPWSIVAPFLLSVFGATFLLTWVFNGTNGSVLLPMLLHATVNTVGAGLIFPLFSGGTLVLAMVDLQSALAGHRSRRASLRSKALENEEPAVGRREHRRTPLVLTCAGAIQ